MRIRTGTVIWAAVLLVLAAVAFGVAVFDLREFQAAAAAWIVTGLGGVFVVAALIALIVRSARPAVVEPRIASEQVSTGSTTAADQPVD